MNIRAITFDVGGTLIEPWPSVGHVYAEVAARFGVNDIAPDGLTQHFFRAWKALSRFDYTRASWFALVRESFAEVAVHLPDAFYPAVYDRFAEPDCWHIFEDVLPALDALADCGLKLGIISNWDERLRPLLDRLGLLHRFAAVVVSCEVGATKPAPELFQRAARNLGVLPAELLHVGDSQAFDVAGAENAGARGLQVERKRRLTASWQVATLTQLPAVISGL
jgi:putative hydrolase of the HAD superfamily